MPKCGSQVILCDVPIRFDTYEGCSHLCEYCFAQRKSSVFNNIKRGETVASLINFIKGQRLGDVSWCDWDIPLHWGGHVRPVSAHRTQIALFVGSFEGVRKNAISIHCFDKE